MASRFVKAVLAAMTIVACGSGDDDTTPAGAPPPPAPETPAAPKALADVVEIDQVDVLQGTSATVLSDAAAVAKPNAPIIVGRPGLVRVHVRPLDTKQKKTPQLAAELHLVNAGQPDIVVKDTPKQLAKFADDDLDTTFDFPFDDKAITADTKLTVHVRDPKNGADPGVDLADPIALHPRTAGNKIKVDFVPIRYDADGSGRLSPLDQNAIDGYKRALYKLYPVNTVEARVRTEQLAWSLPVEARGTGWNQLLSAVMGLRRDDGVDDDVYYVGVFAPTSTMREYCQGGCILGVAPAQMFTDIGLRTAMVVGFPDRPAADGTLAQELAHALGRAHAPCGVAEFVDDKFPYPSAGIGVAGYDIVKNALVSPDYSRYDFMSYCGPVWTSDYTYAAIHAALEQVETAAAASRQHLHEPVRTFLVSGDGEMTLGPAIDVADRAASLDDATTTVRYEDANGNTLAVSKAGYRALSGVGGGVLLANDAPAGATRVRVEGRAIHARELSPRTGERPLR